MKKIIVLAFAAVAAFSSGLRAQEAKQSGEPFRVLMIGNSFSISCMPYLPGVAEAAGKNLDLASLYIGGCSLERHARNIDDELAGKDGTYFYSRSTSGKRLKDVHNARVTDALKSAKWDIVTIQQASHYSWKPGTYRPWADRILRAVRELAPGAKIVVQQTWTYTPFDKRFAQWGFGQDEMFFRLKHAYADFAGEFGFDVIPMGEAVREWRKRLPVKYTENSYGGDVVGGKSRTPDKQFKKDADGKWVPDSDVFHLNEKGEYLQALVWAVKLLGVDPAKLPAHPDFVTDGEFATMAAIALEVAGGNPQCAGK